MHDIWNPWHGCRKCSEGCENCYMYFLDALRGKDGGTVYRTGAGFRYPLSRDKSGAYKVKSGEIVGCGGICYQSEMPSPDNPMGTNGYLMNIYALPEKRGEGIGRKIVEYLIEDAKQRRTEKIYLESSGMARRLYHEIGFSDMKDYMKL